MSMPLLILAQTPVSWTISFDPGADRTLDSLSGSWQVGAPDKTVFDSAYSAPSALVTDTVLPYPVGGISYAGFSVPVNFLGEAVTVSFEHRMDADSDEAFGWLEYYDPIHGTGWTRTDPSGFAWPSWISWSGAGIQTDSMLLFTGPDQGWQSTSITWECTIVVLQQLQYRTSFPDSMRFRFAFHAAANTNGRDGWMIDELVVTNVGCAGGIEEGGLATLSAYPNPASDLLFLERTGTGTVRLELYRADGGLVRRERMTGERHVLDLGDLTEGPYLLRADGGGAQVSRRVVVVH